MKLLKARQLSTPIENVKSKSKKLRFEAFIPPSGKKTAFKRSIRVLLQHLLASFGVSFSCSAYKWQDCEHVSVLLSAFRFISRRALCGAPTASGIKVMTEWV